MERYGSCTDQQLIELFGRKDEEAGNEIAERYYSKVMNVCLGFLRHPQEAQDVAQEVFLRVLAENKMAEFRAESRFWTWFYRVTINACIQHIRKRKNMLSLETLGAGEMLAKVRINVTPEDEVAKSETSEHLWKSLDVLSAKYKAALHSVYFNNISCREAACFLKITIQALRVQICRGKKLLASAYKRQIRCFLQA